MPIQNASFKRDANNVPITAKGLAVSKEVTLSANGTVVVPIFKVTGSVEVVALYGVVTTTLGTNHTAAYWRLNDQTAQAAISLATGTTLSNVAAGQMILRHSLVSVALKVSATTAGAIVDPVAATAPDVFMPFVATQKTGGVETNIEYVYTTNNSSGGVIKFYAGFVPLSDDGIITAY